MTDAREPDSSALRMLGIEVAKLKEQVEALQQRPAGGDSEIEELRDDVGSLASSVADLAESLAEEQGSRPIRAPWWPALDGEERRQAWEDLVRWIDEVLRDRHPELYKGLGRCWYRHPDVVDELCALRVVWHAAYRSKSPLASAAVEWHDRWLPGTVARVTRSLGSCKSSHDAPVLREQVNREELATFIREDVARRSDS